MKWFLEHRHELKRLFTFDELLNMNEDYNLSKKLNQKFNTFKELNKLHN